MAETENQQVHSQPPSRGKKEGRNALLILRRVLAVILTVLLVIAAGVIVVHRDELNLDSIKRYLNYQALERNEEGMGLEFEVAVESSSRFASLDDCLIACSGNRLLVYSNSGSVYLDMEVSISNPVIVTEGNYALVYDCGGSELYLISQRQLVYEYKTADDAGLISARVNANGWLAVVEEAAGYKASATVYNDSYQPVITENISSSFVMDAAVSPDNRQLALVTIGQQDTQFAVTIRLYEFSEGTEQVTQIVSDSPTLDLKWDEDGFWLQEEHGLRRVDNDCQSVGEWIDESRYLRGYSLSGDGFAVEYFSRYRSGKVGTLTVVNEQGQETAEMNLNEEIISVTAAGRYIAVLTHSELTVYTSDLTEYARIPNDGGLSHALVRSDGTVMLVTEENASVFLP